MFATIILICVTVAFAREPSRPSFAYGVLEGNRLILAQLNVDEATWYSVDVAAKGEIKSLGLELPKVNPLFIRYGAARIGPPHSETLSYRWHPWGDYICVVRALRLPNAVGGVEDPIAPTALFRLRVPTVEAVAKKSNDARVEIATSASKRKEVSPGSLPVIDDDKPVEAIDTMSFLSNGEARAASLLRNGPRHHFGFDIVPSGLSIRAVMLVDHTLEVWDYRFKRTTLAPGRAYWTGLWNRSAQFPSPFVEPFYVAPQDGDLAFVLESGAVYLASHAEDKWAIDKIWSDPQRPISTMLSLSDGRVFLFGANFYGRLTKSFVPRPCRNVTGVEEPKFLNEANRRVLTCAQILHEREREPSK